MCKQRRMEGRAFCIKHILEDPTSGFRQCEYLCKKKGNRRCTNPVPPPHDDEYGTPEHRSALTMLFGGDALCARDSLPVLPRRVWPSECIARIIGRSWACSRVHCPGAGRAAARPRVSCVPKKKRTRRWSISSPSMGSLRRALREVLPRPRGPSQSNCLSQQDCKNLLEHTDWTYCCCSRDARSTGGEDEGSSDEFPSGEEENGEEADLESGSDDVISDQDRDHDNDSFIADSFLWYVENETLSSADDDAIFQYAQLPSDASMPSSPINAHAQQPARNN